MDIKIRTILATDIPAVATVHKQSFSRQRHSTDWIQCNHGAFPRILIYVADLNSNVVGYIQWIQKSGFRAECVIELEQIAVLEEHRGKSIGKKLITESLDLVKKHLATNESTLKSILVTTRSDNHAKEIYESTLGAKEVCVIKQLYSGDESILISENI